MITLLNFADDTFKSKQNWNSFTAKLFGKIDNIIEYTPKDIDAVFLSENKKLFKYNKGFGNYFWKPYLINKALKKINEGDYLFYADSGSIFLKSILPLIEHLEKNNKKILSFSLPLIEKQWTKRDSFFLMECDDPKYTDTCQILSGFILIKKCYESENFINQFLTYSMDERVLSDAENVMGLPNHSEFIAHRHDQSIFSLLCKKNIDIVLVEGDLSDYGYFPQNYLYKQEYIYNKEMLDNDKYIFKGTVLCNRKVNPLKYYLKYLIKRILNKFNLKI